MMGMADAVDPIMSLLPSLGPTAGVIVSVILFLRYLAARDTAQEKANEKLFDRVELMLAEERKYRDREKADFLGELRDCRLTNKQVAESMLETNRDVVKTVDLLSNGIASLKQAIQELRDQVSRKMDRPGQV